MNWIGENLKLIGFLVLFGIGFAAGWYVESNIAASRQKRALAAQETALVAKCDADKKLTSEVSNAYQKKLSGLNARIAEYKRLQPTTCVSVTGTASGHNASSSGNVDGGQISVDAILDYAGTAEGYRLQLIGCQDFITKVWHR